MSKPKFIQTAQVVADRLGITVNEVLEKTERDLTQAKFPSAECLHPHEVEKIVMGSSNALAVDRLRHAVDCNSCAALVAAAEADPETIEEMMEELRAVLCEIAEKHSIGPELSEELLQRIPIGDTNS